MDKICLISSLIHTRDKKENLRQEPFINHYHNEVIENLCKLSHDKDIELVLASPFDYDNGIITTGFVWNNTWEIVKTIEPVVVYNRQKYPTYSFMKIQDNLDKNKIITINSMNLCAFMRDKYLTHLKFTEHTIPTVLVTRGSTIKNILEYKFEKEESEFDNNKRVMKPRFGMQSEGLFIANTYPLESTLKHSEYIMQPYFNTKTNIDNKKEEVRMLVVNGKIISSVLSLKSHQHSNISMVEVKKHLPANHLQEYFSEFAKIIDEKLIPCGNRIYSIDVGMSQSGKIKIFELNDSPGILGCRAELSEYVKEYSYGLTDLFRSSIDNRLN